MSAHCRQRSRGETVYQYDDGDGTSEAPDEFVIDGDPAEVGVAVSLWVQAHCQACSQERGEEDSASVMDSLPVDYSCAARSVVKVRRSNESVSTAAH